MHTYIHTYIHTCIHTYIHICIRTCIQYIHTYIYMHKYTHPYTYNQGMYAYCINVCMCIWHSYLNILHTTFNKTSDLCLCISENLVMYRPTCHLAIHLSWRLPTEADPCRLILNLSYSQISRCCCWSYFTEENTIIHMTCSNFTYTHY